MTATKPAAGSDEIVSALLNTVLGPLPPALGEDSLQKLFPTKSALIDGIARALIKAAKDDEVIVVCGAAADDFAKVFPGRLIEIGGAGPNLVTVAAGLALAGKKPFAIAPASLLSTRAYEQIKLDVAYNAANVKLIGTGGGISRGSLGLSHHSPNDIAALCALPDLRVFVPSDAAIAELLVENLAADKLPAYIRCGREAVPDIYDPAKLRETFSPVEAIKHGDDAPELLIVACGETVSGALAAMAALRDGGTKCAVLDMFCLKPCDSDALLHYAKSARAVLTVEEHSPCGGLGAIVAQILSAACPKPLVSLSLPDAPVLCGTSAEIFAECRLDAAGIFKAAKKALG